MRVPEQAESEDAMGFGIRFFPDLGPDVESGRDYWQEDWAMTKQCRLS
jgi:hypothetical protein